MKKAVEKLCIFCDELEFDYEAEGGGCPTCGHGGEGTTDMHCKKDHWRADVQFGLKTYREKILLAKACKDYKQIKLEG